MALKVGQQVWFKEDVEGFGEIAKIVRERNWLGDTTYRYAIRSAGEPSGYPFHRMATYNHELGCMVVWVDEDHVWAAGELEED